MSRDMSQKKIEQEMTPEEISLKNVLYDYTQKRFSEKDSNFLRYINDSSKTLDEFIGFVGDHIEVFMDIIENFNRLIKTQVTDEDGKTQMKQRIKELKETISSLEYVLDDIKKNPLGKKKE